MESNQSNAAAVRAFRILELIGQSEDGCTLADLVVGLALPKQTVHRLVGQLQFAGLVIREPHQRRIQLAARLEQFAISALANGPGRQERHAILARLVERTGETCNLTALAGTDIVYLDRVEATWPLRLQLTAGSHVPLHATSSGKLLTSLLPKTQRDRLLRQLALRRFTENTIVDWAGLTKEISETRRRGYGLSRCEYVRGLIAFAVPVMTDRQRTCAAVTIQVLEARMTMDELLKFLPELQTAALDIGDTFASTRVTPPRRERAGRSAHAQA